MRISEGGSQELNGRLYPDGRPTRVRVEGSAIQSVDDLARVAEPPGGERWLIPGLCDLQVNGFAGHNFIDTQVTIEDARKIAEAVLQTATTCFLPTVITASIDTLCHQVETIADAMEQVPLVRQMCPGIHVEGPFIHTEDGPRGAHPRAHVRPPSIAEFDRVYDAARGHITLLTMGADQPGSADLIRHARSRGVIVSIGHHRPTLENVEAAVAAGATLCTHLGNGSDAVLPRHSNYIWYQLGEDRLMATLIADGQHLPASTLRCMLRAKTPRRSILITDAMGAAGMPSGRYRLGEAEVERTSEGRVVLPGTPYLAGSAADMPLVVGNAVRLGGVTFQEAVAMATLQPWTLLAGHPVGWTCTPGETANMAEVEWDPTAGRLTAVKVAAGSYRCD